MRYVHHGVGKGFKTGAVIGGDVPRRPVSPLPYFPRDVVEHMRLTNRRTRLSGREHGFYAYHKRTGGSANELDVGPIKRGGPLSLTMRPRKSRRLAFSYHSHVTPGDLKPSVNDIVSSIRDGEPLFYIGAPGGYVREFRPRQGTAEYLFVLQHGLMEGEEPASTKASSRLRFTRSSYQGLYVGKRFLRVLDAQPARRLPRRTRATPVAG